MSDNPVSNESLSGTISPEDRLSKVKSLYDAGTGEIIWKNFLAGFSRSLGVITVYIIFILILGSLFVKYLGPLLSPVLNQVLSIYGSLNKIPQFPLH